MKYYAVLKGRRTGVFLAPWDEVRTYVDGFPGAIYKSFSTFKDAQAFLNRSEKSNKISLLKNTRDIIYTDGSCVNEVGGYGFLFFRGEDIETYCGKIEGKTTNQYAELFAIYQSLVECPFIEIDLYTDSKYSINCLTVWYKTWEINGWKTSKGEDVLHQNLIRNIIQILRNKDVKFYHVKGHSGNKYNDLCDKLANEGRML